MSAKSRKRNRRLAALAGLAGAVAFANRKPKQSDVSQDSGRGSGLRPTVDTAKKDTATKPIAKPDTTPKDTTPKDTQPKGSNVRTRQRIVDSSGSTVESAGVKSKDVKGILPPSQNKGNMYAGVGDTNPRSRGYGKKDGGRAEYKSGGKVKGCGKALRGFGKAMKGSR